MNLISTFGEEFSAYLIGILQTDGHYWKSNVNNKGKIILEVAVKDKDLLYKLNNKINPIFNTSITHRSRNTNFKKDYASSILCINQLEFRKLLEPYIPSGKKSGIVEPPISLLATCNTHHYIRGISDGDGSLGITNNNVPFWSFTAKSELIKDFILKNILDVLGIRKIINKNKRDEIYNIMLNNELAVSYLNYIYNQSTIHLDRKYNKYVEILNWERSTPKRKGEKKIWLPEEDSTLLENKNSIENASLLLKRSSSSIKTRLWRLSKAVEEDIKKKK